MLMENGQFIFSFEIYKDAFFFFFNKFEDQTRCQIEVNLKLIMLKGFRINKLLDSLIHFKGIRKKPGRFI